MFNIKRADKFIDKCWKDENAKYDFNKHLDHRYFHLNGQAKNMYWECKWLGTSLGESNGGDGYWIAIRRASVEEVEKLASQSYWIKCSNECREFVIFSDIDYDRKW